MKMSLTYEHVGTPNVTRVLRIYAETEAERQLFAAWDVTLFRRPGDVYRESRDTLKLTSFPA